MIICISILISILFVSIRDLPISICIGLADGTSNRIKLDDLPTQLLTGNSDFLIKGPGEVALMNQPLVKFVEKRNKK